MIIARLGIILAAALRRRSPGIGRSALVTATLSVFCVVVLFPCGSVAEPLEYLPFATIGIETLFGRLDGRLGFDQQNDGIGTLNDFRDDLGLPSWTMTWAAHVAVRPLPPHSLRFFGRLPEVYRGGQLLNRTLQTRNITYDAGTPIQSELTTSLFGFGYDLDFLMGPRWYGGLNGELRHLDFRIRMNNNVSGFEDTLAVSEMVPTLGAHMAYRNIVERGPFAGVLTVGGYARMVFGITPNWLNYRDISAGLSIGAVRGGLAEIEAKFGYWYESVFHNQEASAGRSLEFVRDGVSLSLEGRF